MDWLLLSLHNVQYTYGHRCLFFILDLAFALSISLDLSLSIYSFVFLFNFIQNDVCMIPIRPGDPMQISNEHKHNGNVDTNACVHKLYYIDIGCLSILKAKHVFRSIFRNEHSSFLIFYFLVLSIFIYRFMSHVPCVRTGKMSPPSKMQRISYIYTLKCISDMVLLFERCNATKMKYQNKKRPCNCILHSNALNCITHIFETLFFFTVGGINVQHPSGLQLLTFFLLHMQN